MKVYNDIDSLEEFEPWGPAQRTYDIICDADEGDNFISVLEEVYPEGISETQLNDILAYDSDFALELVGLSDEDE